MVDWTSFWRDFQEQPLLTPLFNLYYQFMEIKRYDHMPFYFYPYAKQWISFEDTIITFLDWLCDAHEQERNTNDKNRTFYQRSIYVYQNFLRYNNDTVANLMFDTKLRKVEYDRVNSVISKANTQYFTTMSAFHTMSFMYLTYFFRFRRVGFVPTLAISSAYYYYFTKTNNIAYKWIVDRKVLDATRQLGYPEHLQPVGHHKNRGLNYV
jgi:hypothetical protein